MLLSRKYLDLMHCLTSMNSDDLEHWPYQRILSAYDVHHQDLFNEYTVTKTIGGIEQECRVVMEYPLKDETYRRIIAKENDALIVVYEQGDCDPPVIVEEDFVAEKLRSEALALKRKRYREHWFIGILVIVAFIAAMLLIRTDDKTVDSASSTPMIEIEESHRSSYTKASALYDDVAEAIVKIEIYNVSGTGSGAATGMVISDDGYIISCDHIYADISAPKFKIILNNGTTYDARYVAGDTEADICLLKITDDVKGLKTVEFGDSDALVSGQECVVLGFPGGSTVEPVITSGLISSRSIELTGLTGYVNEYIQTDAAANPGNSGGGLFNMYGQVVGIVTAKYTATNYENTVYSVPSRTIENVVNQMIQYGFVQRISLGISFSTTSNNDVDAGLPYGCKIAEIKEGGAMQGLAQVGQIIVACNGVEIDRSTSLYSILYSDAVPNRNLTMKLYDPESNSYFEISFEAQSRVGISRYNPIPIETSAGDTIDTDDGATE